MSFQPVDFASDFLNIIGGKKVSSPSTRQVLNPANKNVIANVPVATPKQLDECIAAASTAFPLWAATPVEQRQHKVAQLGDMLVQFKSEFEALLTKEQGKTSNPDIISGAVWEVGASTYWLNDIATQSVKDEVLEADGRDYVTKYHPLGVCAGIVPWNYPLLLMCWKVAPALVTGNCLIIKPSPFTPLCNLKFVELAQQVLPPGVLSVLSGDDNLGPWMTGHQGFARISFTGSTATGKRVLQSASGSIKRVTLELGGNDPAIILPDIDVEKTVPDLFWAAFQNSGQLCVATKRFYAHKDIYEQLKEGLIQFAKTIKMGDGSDPGTHLGPIQNAIQYEKVKGFFDECKSDGLTMAIGGEIDLQSPGYFVPITLIDNPPDNSRIVKEEPFGPIVPLLKWEDEADVIRRANSTEYGLACSVWGKDMERVYRIADQLEAGTVWINETMRLHPNVPFGGLKSSGLGVENSRAGLVAWTNTRVTVRHKCHA